MSCVLDNSVAMRWFFESPKVSDNTYALTVRKEIEKGLQSFVPPIFMYEAGNILIKMGKAGDATNQSLRALQALVKEPVYSQALAFESARVASEYKLTTYDASYLALAMFTTSSLASLDADMVKAARKMGIAITGATL